MQWSGLASVVLTSSVRVASVNSLTGSSPATKRSSSRSSPSQNTCTRTCSAFVAKGIDWASTSAHTTRERMTQAAQVQTCVVLQVPRCEHPARGTAETAEFNRFLAIFFRQIGGTWVGGGGSRGREEARVQRVQNVAQRAQWPGQLA